MNIALIGFMGTGKTSVGRKLADKLDYQFVDVDQKIVEKDEREISFIFADEGEEYFRDLETEVTREVSQQDKQVIATGGGVVLRGENIANLKQGGIVILLTAEPEEIWRRTKDDEHRPLLEVADPLDKIKQLLSQRSAAYDCTPYQLDTTNLTVEEVTQKIKKQIVEKNQG